MTSPPLIFLSLQYDDITSPLPLAPGRVAESCLAGLTPLRYRGLLWLSLDRMKELAIKARARVVPEMAEESSFSETAEDGRGVPGCKAFEGSRVVGGKSGLVSLRPEWLVEAECCIWTFDR
jgi:hypothetical protein